MADTSRDTLQDFDQSWAELRQIAWNLYMAAPAYGVDARGRTTADDYGERVLPADINQRFTEQHQAIETAITQGDVTSAQRLLDALQPDLLQQREQVIQLNRYWQSYYAIRYQQDEWRHLLRDHPSAVNQPRDTQVVLLEQTYTQAVKNDQLAAAADIAARLTDAYSAERQAVMRKVSQPSEPLARMTPCTPTITELAPDGEPRFATSLSDISSYYPVIALRTNMSGRVILNLQIDANGCVTAAGILQSSGTASLDDAALQWVETASFKPASQNGQAIAASKSLAISFKLRTDQLP